MGRTAQASGEAPPPGPLLRSLRPERSTQPSLRQRLHADPRRHGKAEHTHRVRRLQPGDDLTIPGITAVLLRTIFPNPSRSLLARLRT